ncbi:MAG: hypothetical protein AAF431_18380 [Pseudomonadota bacterium]
MKNKYSMEMQNSAKCTQSDSLPEIDEQTNKQLDQDTIDVKRRKTMIGAVATGAALGAWHKPVIEAVILPAHAQTSALADADFFATVASATEVTNTTNVILDALVSPAHAIIAPSNEEPISELTFEAEAISQGGGVFSVRIAADHQPMNGRVAPSNFIFGWDGTISGLNTGASLTGTGCAQNETATITAVSNSSLTLEMSYFSKTIELELSDGSANIPNFPLSCS